MPQNASQKQEVAFFDALKEGSAITLEDMLANFHFSNAVIAQALGDACSNSGKLGCIKVLVPFSNPKRQNSASLQACARRGDLEAVQFLLPLSDPCINNSQSLRIAAENGHMAVVLELLPFAPFDDIVSAIHDASRRWVVSLSVASTHPVWAERDQHIKSVLLHLMRHVGVGEFRKAWKGCLSEDIYFERYDKVFDYFLQTHLMQIEELEPFFGEEDLPSQMVNCRGAWEALRLSKDTNRANEEGAPRRL